MLRKIILFSLCVFSLTFGHISQAADTQNNTQTLTTLIKEYGFTLAIKSTGALLDLTDATRLQLMNGVEYRVGLVPEHNVSSVFVSIGATKAVLEDKNLDGVYEGTLLLALSAGEYSFSMNLLDVSGMNYQLEVPAVVNPTSRVLVRTSDTELFPVSQTEVRVYSFDFSVNDWILWPAERFGQKNPILTDSNGDFILLLPAGKYYLLLKGDTIKDFKSPIFTFNQLTMLTKNFEVEARHGFRLVTADYILFVLAVLFGVLLWYIVRLLRELQQLRKKVGHHSEVELDYLRHMEVYMSDERSNTSHKSLFD